MLLFSCIIVTKSVPLCIVHCKAVLWLMKTNELVKLLKQNGCHLVGSRKKHDMGYSPISDSVVFVPRHGAKEIPTGTLNGILKQAGLQ